MFIFHLHFYKRSTELPWKFSEYPWPVSPLDLKCFETATARARAPGAQLCLWNLPTSSTSRWVSVPSSQPNFKKQSSSRKPTPYSLCRVRGMESSGMSRRWMGREGWLRGGILLIPHKSSVEKFNCRRWSQRNFSVDTCVVQHILTVMGFSRWAQELQKTELSDRG